MHFDEPDLNEPWESPLYCLGGGMATCSPSLQTKKVIFLSNGKNPVSSAKQLNGPHVRMLENEFCRMWLPDYQLLSAFSLWLRFYPASCARLAVWLVHRRALLLAWTKKPPTWKSSKVKPVLTWPPLAPIHPHLSDSSPTQTSECCVSSPKRNPVMKKDSKLKPY